jgi:NADH-quinone oxidoreductase subunit M
MPLLSLLIWIPILGGVAVLAVGASRPQMARSLSLLVSLGHA